MAAVSVGAVHESEMLLSVSLVLLVWPGVTLSATVWVAEAVLLLFQLPCVALTVEFSVAETPASAKRCDWVMELRMQYTTEA